MVIEEITSIDGEFDDTESDSSADDGDTPAGPHVLPDKKESLDFFDVFFTNELASEIVIETNKQLW